MDSTSVKPRNSILKTYIELAKEFEQSQLFTKAEQTLLMALQKAPNDIGLLDSLCLLYLRLDLSTNALKVANKMVRISANKQTYLRRAEIYELREEYPKAERDYTLALANNKTDLDFLNELLQIQIRLNHFQDALDLIRSYQVMLKKPLLFAEQQSLLFIELKNVPAAFRVLRLQLLADPLNKALIIKYLELANKTSSRAPRDVFEYLNLSVPGIVTPSDEDFDHLQIDYLRRNNRNEEALEFVNLLLMKQPENLTYRKLRAFIRLETGEIEDAVTELKLLFGHYNDDLDIRNALENYYRLSLNLQEWKRIYLQKVNDKFRYLETFKYLRKIGNQKDQLALSELTLELFYMQVHELNIANADLTDKTYKKLPSYVLELFIAHFVLENEIPTPEILLQRIEQHLQSKEMMIPFDTEDLYAAICIYIYSIHIYFLFKEYTNLPVVFNTLLLQNEDVVLQVLSDNKTISISIQELLSDATAENNSIIIKKDAVKWFWKNSYAESQTILSSIPFFDKNAFEAVISKLGEDLGKKGLVISIINSAEKMN